MIVVVGRPGLDARGRLDRPAGRVALAAAEAGAGVELVGSVADNAEGDATALELGRAGIGHAALLRMPAAGEGGAPRLEAADIELGLNYLAECQVLVAAEPLDADATAVVVAAAAYHAAALIAVTATDQSPTTLPDHATVLTAPGEDAAGAFADFLGRYAAHLDAGRPAADAWRDALTDTGWQAGPA